METLSGVTYPLDRSMEIALGLIRHGESSALQSRFDAELSLRYPWLTNDNKARLFRYSVYQATKTARIGDLPRADTPAVGAGTRATSRPSTPGPIPPKA